MFRIRSKVIALTLLVALVGIAATGYLFSRKALRDHENQVLEINAFLAPSIATSVETFLKRLGHSVKLFDQTPGSGIGRFERFFEGLNEVEGLIQLKNGKFRRAFLKSHDQEAFFSNLKLPRGSFREGNWCLLYFEVSGRKYYAITRRKVLERFFGIASAFRVALVSARGLVASNAELGGLKEIRKSLSSERLESRSNKLAVSAREIKSESGDAYLTAVSPVDGSDPMAIVVQTEKSQMAALIWQGLKESFEVIGVVLLGVILLSILFSAKLTRPIENLIHATSRIAKGEWKIKIPSATRDELGLLVSSFSTMSSELESREEELKETHRKLLRSEKLASLGTFSAGVAHEVKNPLGSILGNAQLAQRQLKQADADQTSDLSTFLKAIVSETYRASKIVTDLLSFSRQKEPELVQQDLRDLVQQLRDSFAAEAEQAGVKFEVIRPENSLEAKIDRDQIYQVILNLLGNAVQAMNEAGGSDKRLQLFLVQKGAGAVMSVKDSGPGIPQENIDKIFEPFFSTKGEGKGTGLGLSICYGIVEQHGGKIEVHSKLGEGTEFRVVLPG